MKKNGLTLVELLAVIVILAIILAIAIPSVTNIISNSKTSSYSNQLEMFKRAANLYVAQNNLSGSNISVSLNDLVTAGLLPSNIKNAVTGQNYSTGMNFIVKSNGTNIVDTYEGPELSIGMIPVYYDGTNWVKADQSNASNQWYDYGNQKWANAVTVCTSGSGTGTDGVTRQNRSQYQGAAAGTAISMSDINAFFVWIPRYKYMIPAGSGAREILISFETKYTPKSTGDAVTSYYTHPAFTFGITELNGIWVGKFETTGNITSPTILPDTTSLRSQTIKAMYDSVKNNMQSSSTYGFSTDSDIHIMKNTEWGAVTYLYYSRYGKYGNISYTAINKELYLNNSLSYYTGRSSGVPGGSGVLTPTYEYSSSGYYTYDGKCAMIYTGLVAPCTSGSTGQALTDKNYSYGASTTGNIYGIYDMSGGAWDYLMGMYKPVIMSGIVDQGGYSTSTTNSQYDLLTINPKYYDQYLTSSASTGAILGDATKEVNNWYNDTNSLPNVGYPWLGRGGTYANGANAGIFNFGNLSGAVNGAMSFRVALAPNP